MKDIYRVIEMSAYGIPMALGLTFSQLRGEEGELLLTSVTEPELGPEQTLYSVTGFSKTINLCRRCLLPS